MPSIQDLKHAITLSEKIDALKKELDALLGGVSSSASTSTGKKRGRPAKVVDSSSEPVEAKPERKKRKMSPEALEKIRAAQKKRWAAFHKAQKAEAKA